MNILKSVLVWLCFIPVAILNGGLREHVLDRALGEELRHNRAVVDFSDHTF